MYFCIYLLYVFFSNLELCLSCSSRTAIDVFESRARSYYCLSLNKRFVVVVVVGIFDGVFVIYLFGLTQIQNNSLSGNNKYLCMTLSKPRIYIREYAVPQTCRLSKQIAVDK